MFTWKKVGLAVATLTVLEVASFNPAQAISFDFHFTSPIQPIPGISPDGISSGGIATAGRLIIREYANNSSLEFPNVTDLNVNNDTATRSTLILGNSFGTIQEGFTSIIRLADKWLIEGHSEVHSYNNYPARTLIHWYMNLSCSLPLMDCNNSLGTMQVKLGAGTYPIATGQGEIRVENFLSTLTPTPTPTSTATPLPNSVPEPSLVLALLLLGGGCFLQRKVRVNT